jgi:hypothetical protein
MGPSHAPQTAQASGQQSPKFSHDASQKQPAGAWPEHDAAKALQPQSLAQLCAVSPGWQSPLPQIGPPHEPQAAHASGQQSPKPTHAGSQKHPAAAAPPQVLAPSEQPQSKPHEAAVSPGSQVPSPQNLPHESQLPQASWQQSPNWVHAGSQKQPPGA